MCNIDFNFKAKQITITDNAFRWSKPTSSGNTVCVHNVHLNKFVPAQEVPFLSEILPKFPHVTYRRHPTLKNTLAPSKLRRHRGTLNPVKLKGVFKCGQKIIYVGERSQMALKEFSIKTGECFMINHFFNCQTSYVIYLIQCSCKKTIR